MTDELSERDAEIVQFMRCLTVREQLVALEYLAKNSTIVAFAPEFPRVVDDGRQAWEKVRKAIDGTSEPSNVSLAFLARVKGCHLQQVEGNLEHWHIFRDDHIGLVIEDGGDKRDVFTLEEAMDALRALPDTRE